MITLVEQRDGLNHPTYRYLNGKPCDGNCEHTHDGHKGQVKEVTVQGFAYKEPVKFLYCENAIETDKGNGYIESPMNCTLSKNPSNQIAIGDTQGSRHCIDNLNNVEVFQKTNPGMLDGPVLLVKSPITITHPEHGHVELPIGCYEITYQKNLDAEEREMRALD